MLVLLSGYEPAYAVGPQDSVQSEACDEEDGEDQQPVDAPHGNAREGTEAVYVCHISIRAGFKTWNTQNWIFWVVVQIHFTWLKIIFQPPNSDPFEPKPVSSI